MSSPERSTERCIHGMIREWCSLCNPMPQTETGVDELIERCCAILEVPMEEETKICMDPECEKAGQPQPLSAFYGKDTRCRKCRNRVAYERKKARKAAQEPRSPRDTEAYFVAMRSNSGQMQYTEEGPVYEMWEAKRFREALQAGQFPDGVLVVKAAIAAPVRVAEKRSYELGAPE